MQIDPMEAAVSMSKQTTPETPTEVSTETSEPQQPLTRQQKRWGKRKRAKYLAREIQHVAKSQGTPMSRKARRKSAFDFAKEQI